jgi:hypothetical protein
MSFAEAKLLKLVQELSKALGGSHPTRLFFGVSLAFAAQMLIHVLTRTYPANVQLAALDEYSVASYVLIVVPYFFLFLFYRSRGAEEKVVTIANTVEFLVDKAGLTEVERRMAWRLLVSRYLSEVQAQDLRNESKGSALDNVADMASDVIDEIRSSNPQSPA